MRGTHEYDAFGTIKYATEMSLGVTSRAKDGHLADKAAQTVGDEDKGTR